MVFIHYVLSFIPRLFYSSAHLACPGPGSLCSLSQRMPSTGDTGSHQRAEGVSASDVRGKPGHHNARPEGSAPSTSSACLSLLPTSFTTTEILFHEVCMSTFTSGRFSQFLYPEAGHPSFLMKRQMHGHTWRGREGHSFGVRM